MARGIVTVKPAGGTTAGKITVTNSSPGFGTGSTTSETGASTAAELAQALPIGSTVTYTQDTNANLGDIVDFVVADDRTAVDVKLYKAGRCITGEINGNVIVEAGDSVLISAHIDGKILVNGGMLTVLDNSHIESKIESSVDGSYIFVSGTHIEGRVAVAGASYLDIRTSVIEGAVFSDSNLFSAITDTTVKGKVEATNAKNLNIKNTIVDGKVTSNGGAYTSVVGCTIKGRLEVLSVTKCQCTNNRVDGKTNTPGCTA